MESPTATSPSTKDLLADALFSLMREQPFSRITVSDIARAAHVNRSTFYRNAPDKESLVHHFVARIMDEYLAAFRRRRDYSFRSYMTTVFNVLKQHECEITAIVENGLGDMLLDGLTMMFEQGAGTRDLPLEKRYHIRTHAGGIYGHIRYWVSRGMEDSPETMADYCCSLFGENFMPFRIQMAVEGVPSANGPRDA